MANVPTLTLVAALLTGCYGSKGVRPGPRGVAVVVLEADGAGHATPVACYDPLWVELRGPRDCADLVPPRAWLRFPGGGQAVVLDRGPADCGVRFTLQGPAKGLAVWAEDNRARLGSAGVDLDADGVPERVERRGDRWRVSGARGAVEGCPSRHGDAPAPAGATAGK